MTPPPIFLHVFRLSNGTPLENLGDLNVISMPFFSPGIGWKIDRKP
jgi:hypothetical protein